ARPVDDRLPEHLSEGLGCRCQIAPRSAATTRPMPTEATPPPTMVVDDFCPLNGDLGGRERMRFETALVELAGNVIEHADTSARAV
ncbi:hypothetical protein J7E22_10130, partial [Curtobacterium sp. ISL-83]|nr:hypothetical protein [Curtobacterium sp. ISL-83]